MNYYTFSRTWWVKNPITGQLTPQAGEKTYHEEFETREEAIAYCKEWNENHDEGELSLKCEFDSL